MFGLDIMMLLCRWIVWCVLLGVLLLKVKVLIFRLLVWLSFSSLVIWFWVSVLVGNRYSVLVLFCMVVLIIGRV